VEAKSGIMENGFEKNVEQRMEFPYRILILNKGCLELAGNSFKKNN
jgi:hypothetical protein